MNRTLVDTYEVPFIWFSVDKFYHLGHFDHNFETDASGSSGVLPEDDEA